LITLLQRGEIPPARGGLVNSSRTWAVGMTWVGGEEPGELGELGELRVLQAGEA
jgi:hypothetical protein